MPPLRNPRHERFIQFLLEGKTALDAYEAAGYARDDANASRLSNNPKVRHRLAELQGEIAAETTVTVKGLLNELEDARKKATDLKQLSAAIKAIEGKAKLSGLLVDKKQVEVTGSVAFNKDDITDEEIVERMVDQMLKYGVNDYHDYRPEDRDHLVQLFTRHFKAMFEETGAYMDAIKARPYRTNYQPKALASPYANGKTRY
jgi:phage terminase small subunit